MTAHFVNLLDELMRRSLRMASAVEDMVAEGAEAVANVDHALAHRIIDRDEEIDEEEVAIEAEALRLMTLFQPMGTDMRQLCTILKVNNDLERVADCVVNIAQRTAHLDRDVIQDCRADLDQVFPVVRRMLHEVVHAYATVDRELAERVREQDEVVDAFYGQFIRRMVAEAADSPALMAARLDVLSIAKNIESIADQTTNIAEDVIFLATGRIVRHQHD